MNLRKKIPTLLFGLLLTTISYGQTTKPTEYLGVNQIKFDNFIYNIVWTSHPTDNYFKQEYLPTDETLRKFKKLLLLELIIGDLKPKDAVAIKIAELEKMKKTNPVVNYQVLKKDGEITLDFLVSADTPDGKRLSIIERNVYRYKSIVLKNGQKAILLFGVSERAYDDDIMNFLTNLKENKFDLIKLVGGFKIPKIKMTK